MNWEVTDNGYKIKRQSGDHHRWWERDREGHCEGFVSEGATVVLAATTLSKLEEAVEEFEAMGGRAKAIQTDVSDEKQVIHMVSETIRTFGKIDILVNNSGIAGPTCYLVDLKLEDWNQVLVIDLTGYMLCAKALKHMIMRKSGNIINIAAEGGRTGDGRSGYPMRASYCCAKMGVIGLTETSPRSLAPIISVLTPLVRPASGESAPTASSWAGPRHWGSLLKRRSREV